MCLLYIYYILFIIPLQFSQFPRLHDTIQIRNDHRVKRVQEEENFIHFIIAFYTLIHRQTSPLIKSPFKHFNKKIILIYILYKLLD